MLFSVNVLTCTLPRFSGIKSEDLVNVENTLEDAQRAVCRLISWDCFIVGHSLESDLHALKVNIWRTLYMPTILHPHSRNSYSVSVTRCFKLCHVNYDTAV